MCVLFCFPKNTFSSLDRDLVRGGALDVFEYLLNKELQFWKIQIFLFRAIVGIFKGLREKKILVIGGV